MLLVGRLSQGLTRAILVASLLLIVFIGGMIARQKRGSNRELIFRGLPGFLSEQLAPEEPLGYLMSHKAFLFYGPSLQRRVLFIPASDDENREQWVARLREQGVNNIAVGKLSMAQWNSRKELLWLKDPDGPFQCSTHSVRS